MTKKLIIYLNDLSVGVHNLSKISKITHIYPFLSCVGVETTDSAEKFKKYHYVSSVAHAARVSIGNDKAMQAIGANVVSGSGGVNVAIIDTGISRHVDFTLPQRIVEFVDFIGEKDSPYDDNGHGTAVAGVLAGSGLMSGGKYSGVAPDCNIVALKAIGSDGEGGTLEILQAMQWLYSNHKKYDIKVVCMSFGAQSVGKNDPLALGAAALWQQGLVVVASSGNAGPTSGSITSPGICPDIITVGGADIDGTQQVADFSSRGPANGFNKPDIVAPAVNIVSCGITDDYINMSGTSISTPMVAGAAALVLSKRPSYTPDKVKELILKSAKKMSCPINSCGHGMLDVSSLMQSI